MMKRKLGFILLLVCLVSSGLFAQRVTDLVINEVLTNNQHSFIDGHGDRGAWIEIYNNSAGTVDIAGCYLTNDPTNLKKYRIRKEDIRTRIAPFQRTVFFANSEVHHSVFHTNFSLEASRENYIALISANGSTIIDEVKVPVLTPDQTWGSGVDGDKADRKVLNYPTPDAANYVSEETDSIARFKENDPKGIGMALTAMMVVFSALLCIFISFKIIGRIAMMLSKARARKAAGLPKDADLPQPEAEGEVYAAIALALQLVEEGVHDYEDTVLTMTRVEKRYSPWSSKLYGLKELPVRK